MGWLERRTVTRDFPIRVEPVAGTNQFTVTVTRRATGWVIYRGTFPSRPEGERAALAFASVRWQVAHVPELREVEFALHYVGLSNDPFGSDGVKGLQVFADRSDRFGRGHGLGLLSDNASWLCVLEGDVAGVLSRFSTRPFGWSDAGMPA
jgi:hypothetical protein